MTDADWAVVRPLLPVPGWLRGRGGQPEAYCHRAILDAIGYLVDNGIKWRAMPADFPPWDLVYAFFRCWRDHALVKEFHDRLRSRIRERDGRDTEPTAGVIDSQSVKADSVVGSDSRGFDGAKLVNGRKRHVVVDTLGLLLGVMVTAADTGDRAAAQVLLRQVTDAHHRLELVWADGGYAGSLITHCLTVFALVLAIVKRSDDMRGFVVLPKRWIVERLRPPDAHPPPGTRLRTPHHQCRSDDLLVDVPAHDPPPRLATPCASMNRPGAGSASQPAPRDQTFRLRPQRLRLGRHRVQTEQHGQLLAGQPLTPHRNLRPRPRGGRRRRYLLDLSHGRRCPIGLGVTLSGLVHGSQHLADPRAGDGPLPPFPLGHGQLGLDAIGLFPQPVHATAGGDLALFQQPHDRRHPRPPPQ